ncbi:MULTISPECIES: Crp/Fnr family transcriptional regulator [Halomonas]|uniref:CRP-like cAMP-binding protein n=1 Tax=Halomonas ventosae TaxID=229007 RepID=A0A4R6HLM3_9GAMM|nr:Crp/Fnr family transcriptional regulator [Halomonas ventosae]TDO09780.1 CRP-like cAMP-binding protein [Halomonas ventosae]
MQPSSHTPTANRLVDSLPGRERDLLVASSETVELVFGEVLVAADEPLSHVYFPQTSVISLIASLNDGERLEVAMAGSEGMFGVSLILGVGTSPLLALVQGGGSALRIPAAGFQHLLAGSPVLQGLLNRYLHVLMHQLARTAACSHFHPVEARLARWLLMTQDRTHTEMLHLTHEFLAMMLGVRRAGITLAAMSLQGRELISYHRGDISVIDRAGLIEASCGCYAVDRSIYRGVITEGEAP